MFVLMVVVFILGYIAIALEHPLKIDKDFVSERLSEIADNEDLSRYIL